MAFFFAKETSGKRQGRFVGVLVGTGRQRVVPGAAFIANLFR